MVKQNVNSEFFLVSIGATDEAAVANYPNPFGDGSGETKITYIVTDPSASLSLRIYDQFGQSRESFSAGRANPAFRGKRMPVGWQERF